MPLERSLPPDVHVRDYENHDEEQELEEPEPRELMEDHRERVEKHDLDVEDDEQHRRQVEADREALLARRAGGDARLERDRPGPHAPVRTRREGEREPHHGCGNDQREERIDQERQPVVEHAPPLRADGNLTRSPWRYEEWRKPPSYARVDCHKVSSSRGDSQGPGALLRSVSRWRSRNESCR